MPLSVVREPGKPCGSDSSIAGTTVKFVLVDLEVDPVATTLSGPLGDEGIIISVDQIPCELAVMSVLARLLPKTTAMGSKDFVPDPETRIVVPGGPLVGWIRRPAPKTKVAHLTLVSDVDTPELLIVYVPAIESGALKLEDHDPCESAEIPEETVFPSKVNKIPVSPDLKPIPVTDTVSPGAASGCPKDNVAVTVKVVWSLPDALLAPTDFAPPDVLAGISTVVTIFPVLSELVDESTTPDIVRSTGELGANPDPLTVIGVPGGPLSGVTLKEDVIVNVLVKVLPILTV